MNNQKRNGLNPIINQTSNLNQIKNPNIQLQTHRTTENIILPQNHFQNLTNPIQFIDQPNNPNLKFNNPSFSNNQIPTLKMTSQSSNSQSENILIDDWFANCFHSNQGSSTPQQNTVSEFNEFNSSSTGLYSSLINLNSKLNEIKSQDNIPHLDPSNYNRLNTMDLLSNKRISIQSPSIQSNPTQPNHNFVNKDGYSMNHLNPSNQTSSISKESTSNTNKHGETTPNELRARINELEDLSNSTIKELNSLRNQFTESEWDNTTYLKSDSKMLQSNSSLLQETLPSSTIDYKLPTNFDTLYESGSNIIETQCPSTKTKTKTKPEPISELSKKRKKVR
ncbi:hypothetical protein BC833DRAFT_610838 [Globomyces pollinis-pini]|nr:hypothetical protein BC833DRAFT_610838 [Globomyces pollinis-pini]